MESVVRILTRAEIERQFHKLDLRYGQEILSQQPELLLQGVSSDDPMPFTTQTYEYLKGEKLSQCDEGRYARESALLLFKLVRLEPVLHYLNLRIDGPRFRGTTLTRKLENTSFPRIPLGVVEKLSAAAVQAAERRGYPWNHSPGERTYQERILAPIVQRLLGDKCKSWLQVYDGSEYGLPKLWCGPACTDFLFVGMHSDNRKAQSPGLPQAHATALEVDGEVHDKKRIKDETRDWFLRSIGISVLRFPNSEVERLGARYPRQVLSQSLLGPKPWSLHPNGQPRTNKQQRDAFLRMVYIYNIASHLTLQQADEALRKMGESYRLLGGIYFLIGQKSSNRTIQRIRKFNKSNLLPSRGGF